MYGNMREIAVLQVMLKVIVVFFDNCVYPSCPGAKRCVCLPHGGLCLMLVHLVNLLGVEL